MADLEKTQTKREAIIESAYHIFTEQGYHAAKVSDVAKLAKVGKGTVYEYFASKEDLLRGVIEEGIKYYLQELNKSAKSAELPWDKIKLIMKKNAEIIQNNQNMAQLISNNFGIMTEEFHQFLMEQRQVLITTLKEIIEEGISLGHLRLINSEIGARLIIASMMSIDYEIDYIHDKDIEEILNALANGLLKQ